MFKVEERRKQKCNFQDNVGLKEAKLYRNNSVGLVLPVITIVFGDRLCLDNLLCVYRNTIGWK